MVQIWYKNSGFCLLFAAKRPLKELVQKYKKYQYNLQVSNKLSSGKVTAVSGLRLCTFKPLAVLRGGAGYAVEVIRVDSRAEATATDSEHIAPCRFVGLPCRPSSTTPCCRSVVQSAVGVRSWGRFNAICGEKIKCKHYIVLALQNLTLPHLASLNFLLALLVLLICSPILRPLAFSLRRRQLLDLLKYVNVVLVVGNVKTQQPVRILLAQLHHLLGYVLGYQLRLSLNQPCDMGGERGEVVLRQCVAVERESGLGYVVRYVLEELQPQTAQTTD